MAADGPVLGIDPKTGRRRTLRQYMALLRKWESKMKQNGFVDIEGVGPTGLYSAFLGHTGQVDADSIDAIYEAAIGSKTSSVIRPSEFESYLRIDDTVQGAAYDYYARCRQFLHARAPTGPKGSTERKAWEMYSNGAGRLEIIAALRISRASLHRMLTDLNSRMLAWWHATAEEREQEKQIRTEDGRDPE